jgi:diketogulonate reductase-like aldo/keto reductase
VLWRNHTEKVRSIWFLVYSVPLLRTAPAQVLLAWALQQGLAVIPKSNNHERLVANLESGSVSLSEADIKHISSLNINLRVRFKYCDTDVN